MDTCEGEREAGLSKGKLEPLSVAEKPLSVTPWVAVERGCPSHLSRRETRRLDLSNPLLNKLWV